MIGLGMKLLWMGIDSLYLVLPGDFTAICDMYYEDIVDIPFKKRSIGKVVGDVVVRGGSNGYIVSVWRGDARVYLSRDQKMGLWIQLGPRWLVEHRDRLSLSVKELLHYIGVSVLDMSEIRLNRLDWAIDVEHDLGKMSLDELTSSWVGYASPANAHGLFGDWEARMGHNGRLQTFGVGKSGSGAVRFKMYDKLAQSKFDNDLEFWMSCWGVTCMDDMQVTRFEWSTFPYKANFFGKDVDSNFSFRYLKDLNSVSIGWLVDYLVNRWGRLAVPDMSDSNKSRWDDHALWVGIREHCARYKDDAVRLVRNYAPGSYDLKPEYVEVLSGWIGGAMARVALVYGWDEPPDFEVVLQHIRSSREWGYEQKARDKLARWLVLLDQSID